MISSYRLLPGAIKRTKGEAGGIGAWIVPFVILDAFSRQTSEGVAHISLIRVPFVPTFTQRRTVMSVLSQGIKRGSFLEKLRTSPEI